MSINKKALTRYLAYDRCLRNRGRKWTWKDLLDAANDALQDEVNPKTGMPMKIGKTQLYEDLKAMEYKIWKAPIERNVEGKTVYFRYEDTDFSINNQPLSETEARQLKSAIHVLTRFKGMPQFEWVNEIIPALETKLGLVLVDREIISFDSNADYEGMAYITPLFNAIVNKRVLKVSYQDFKSPIPYDITFHPYYLKQFNNRWFAFGLNPAMENANWNLALDRIKNIEEVKDKYNFTDVDWDDYFYDFIGVTKQSGETALEIKFLFCASQAPYIVTKPLHPTQKHKHDENGLEVSITVIPNHELEKLILSFGENVKVLSPKSFQKKITQRIKLLNQLYS
ncbi:MAG: WYL domain-containing protein [Chitinophagaceae bacterium]